jgi:hypothetical protein
MRKTIGARNWNTLERVKALIFDYRELSRFRGLDYSFHEHRQPRRHEEAG